jgi:hypothetical protein
MITDIKVSFSRVANGEGTVSCFSTTRTVLERRSHAGWSIINNHHFHLLFSRLQEHFRHIDLNTMQPQSNRISLSEFLHMRMTLIICQTANPTASMGRYASGLGYQESQASRVRRLSFMQGDSRRHNDLSAELKATSQEKIRCLTHHCDSRFSASSPLSDWIGNTTARPVARCPTMIGFRSPFSCTCNSQKCPARLRGPLKEERPRKAKSCLSISPISTLSSSHIK